MIKNKISNYETQCEEWRARFLTMDISDICARLPEIKIDNGCLTLWHFGRHFAVSMADGTVTVLSDDKPADVTPKMNIYTLLWYASPSAALSGEWLPFRDLKGASPFSKAFQNGILEPLALTFTGNAERLAGAVNKLRGRRLSDTGFLVPAFECMPLKLNFWDADEEFPAQASLLFDKSAVDYIHVESVVTIASECLYQLADAAGLPLQGSAFFRY